MNLVCVCVSCSVMSDSLLRHGLEPTARLLCPWNSPGNSTGVGCCFLLPGIFPSRDWTQISHTAGRLFTVWATREDLFMSLIAVLFTVVPNCKQLECPTTGDMWYIHTVDTAQQGSTAQYCSARKWNEYKLIHWYWYKLQLDESQKHYAKQEKTTYPMYDSIHQKFYNMKINL